MSGGLPAIDKLEGSLNYSNWKFAMQMYLTHEGLWDCVQTGEDGQVKNKDAEKEKKALAKICLLVQPSTYIHIRNADSAKKAWDNLQKAYEDKGLTRRLGLLRLLFGLKYENFKSMEAYVTETLSISLQLSDIGAPLDDEFIAVIMLSGLPSEFNPMVMALENTNVKLTSDMIKTKLLQEDLKTNGEERADAALISRNTRNRSGDSSINNKKKNYKCFRCNKEGHFARDCKVDITEEKQEKGSLLCALSTFVASEDWYIDSGATNHMSHRKDWMENYLTVDEKKEITVANNGKLHCEGMGNVKVKIAGSDIEMISNVSYVPGLATNLLSVSSLVKKGFTVVFSSNGCKLYNNCKISGEVRATASDYNGLFKLVENRITQNMTTMLVNNEVTHEMWHKRLGHLNRHCMNLLKNGVASGVNFKAGDGKRTCIACLEGKQTRKPFPKMGKRAKDKLELIHSDLCGPINTQSHSGMKYLLTFIDDYTRKTFGYFLKHKYEVKDKFMQFKALVENQSEKRIKRIRTDNGREYVNNELEEFLRKNGIKHETTVGYTPEQNGVAERANRTIFEKVRCLLQDAQLNQHYWAEAANTVIYLKNRSPTKAVLGETPEEKWTEEKIDLSHLKIFGCMAYVHVPDVLRKKLDSKSKPYIFVGYCENTKGYRLIDPNNPRSLVKARDVVFLENEFCEKISENGNLKPCSANPVSLDSILDTNYEEENRNYEEETEENCEINRRQVEINKNCEHCNEEEEVAIGRYPRRKKMVKRDPDFVYLGGNSESKLSVPSTVKEAIEKQEWKDAMDDEYNSLLKNQTWILTNLPKNRKPLSSKWVYKIKTDAEGNFEKYKARLVIRGFLQEYGVDYYETFSPVARYDSIRFLLAMAASKNYYLYQFDVKTAFLHGDLDEEIYMVQPEGYDDESGRVCLLKRSLYGLKQAPKKWNEKLTEFLKNHGFNNCETDPCVFVDTSKAIWMSLYVDDGLIVGEKLEDIKKILKDLDDAFKISFSEASSYLGLNIHRRHDCIFINQENYAKNILKKFNMEDCNPVTTPISCGDYDDNSPDVEGKPYREVVGSLLYLSTMTRPDIAYALNFFGRFMEKPKICHWNGLKRILRYIKGTAEYGILYTRARNGAIEAFCDADFAGDKSDRKSTSGHLIKCSGGAIMWGSKKQRCVAMSTAEAEYISASEATKEILWLHQHAQETNVFNKDKKIPLFVDNNSAILMIKREDGMVLKRTKHIDIKYHFLREKIGKELEVFFVDSSHELGDIFTKPLPPNRFQDLRKQLGINKCPGK